MRSSIAKRTITPTIAYSSFSSQYSRRSILSIPCKGHFASGRIGTALLHQQHPLFRRTSDRRDYGNERYHQCYAIFFLAQTTLISFNLFRTLI